MSLCAHVSHAIKSRWTLPDIERSLAGEGGPLLIEEMWPYWMPLGKDTIQNSLDLENIILLTGCNTGGKSTLLRSVGAVCLLGSCGLAVPASAASIPHMDAIVVRTFVGDSPIEGKSGFAVEMSHMSVVLSSATKDTLVLVDELGKGTEIKAGASLAACVLKEVSRRECRGIFATHFHHLVDLFQSSGWPVRCMRIGAVEGSESSLKMKMSRKLEDGFTRTSAGFHVARAKGLPKKLVDRALALRDTLVEVVDKS